MDLSAARLAENSQILVLGEELALAAWGRALGIGQSCVPCAHCLVALAKRFRDSMACFSDILQMLAVHACTCPARLVSCGFPVCLILLSNSPFHSRDDQGPRMRSPSYFRTVRCSLEGIGRKLRRFIVLRWATVDSRLVAAVGLGHLRRISVNVASLSASGLDLICMRWVSLPCRRLAFHRCKRIQMPFL